MSVKAEVFTPWIPLSPRESAHPATVIRFTLENTTDEELMVSLTGWLENGVCLYSRSDHTEAKLINQIDKTDNLTFLHCVARDASSLSAKTSKVEKQVFAEFEGVDYGNWKTRGRAFGDGPHNGIRSTKSVENIQSKTLADSFRDRGDPLTGKLISPEFTITYPYIKFYIAGGNHEHKTCINLIVDDKVARTSTGDNTTVLKAVYWDVEQLKGKTARIEIIDEVTGRWGHISIDQIEFTTGIEKAEESRKALAQEFDFGSMGLALLGEESDIQLAEVAIGDLPASLFSDEQSNRAERPFRDKLVGALGRKMLLSAYQKREVVFLVTWYFPNFANPKDRGNTGAVGRMYANWFDNAFEVAKYITDNFASLDYQTHLFHDTYYDTTLPYWFVQRISMPVSTLSTLTSQWWKNGRFYHYEGVGFCAGTCTHVYVYSQATARLFPQFERIMRQEQDLAAPAQDPETGRINFRGRDYHLGEGIHASGYAADGQCGVVLRAYREHLMSPDSTFLDDNWPQIKLAMEYMITKDGEDGKLDGIIERRQHSTWDTDFYGANTYIGSLYLAALKACEEMALIKGEEESAKRYRDIFVKGSSYTQENLWNGDYFIGEFPGDVPVVPSTSWGEVAVQYANGCFSNQLFGQNYAAQLGLGYIYPCEMVLKSLKSIYRYNWLPDMDFLYRQGRPYAYLLASSGEAGLLQCSWPLDKRPLNDVKLVEHVWTGFEYQVASHMLYEGLLKEGLAIVRGIHDRYNGVQHNPWNEIEGGDHYGRAMASWGCLLNISGFIYDGPAGKIGFVPRFKPEDFKAFFTSAEGWGSLIQKRHSAGQTNRIEIKWGKLRANELIFALPPGKEPSQVNVWIDKKPINTETTFESGQIYVTLSRTVTVEANSTITVEINY